MYYMFFSTNDVFQGEDILKSNNIDYKIVPTPVKEKIYCGVCIWSDDDENIVRDLLANLNVDILV